jgi:hypothetical protein
MPRAFPAKDLTKRPSIKGSTHVGPNAQRATLAESLRSALRANHECMMSRGEFHPLR